MALGSDAIELLIRLKGQGCFNDQLSVIEIGAQQLANSFLEVPDRLADVGGLFGAIPPCPLPRPRPTRIVHGELEHLAEDAPAAREFWKWLGFDYAAIDIDGSPGSIPLDLNYDPAPNESLGKYQLVTNFGTTEHVANQLNAFKVIHDLAAPGGVMIHHLPMQGMLNHGLVNYNPKFFWMLARSNGYRLLYMNVAAGTSYYTLPDNIADSVSPFEPDIEVRRHDLRVADTLVVAILQKVFDTPYVAPIDVQTGTRTDNKVLEERYWSVFKPNAFDDRAHSVPYEKDQRGGWKWSLWTSRHR
jgi:SAM-dependent methyltransferase